MEWNIEEVINKGNDIIKDCNEMTYLEEVSWCCNDVNMKKEDKGLEYICDYLEMIYMKDILCENCVYYWLCSKLNMHGKRVIR